MSKLDIIIRGPAGAGKTSLLRVIANAVEWVGEMVVYHDDAGVERATLTVDDPVGLAKWTDRNFPTLDKMAAHERNKHIPYTEDTEKLIEKVQKLLKEHGLEVHKIDNTRLNIGRRAELSLLDVFHRL